MRRQLSSFVAFAMTNLSDLSRSYQMMVPAECLHLEFTELGYVPAFVLYLKAVLCRIGTAECDSLVVRA